MEQRRSLLSGLSGGVRTRRVTAHQKSLEQASSLNLTHWLDLCKCGNFTELWRCLADYLSVQVPQIYSVNNQSETPWTAVVDENRLHSQLIYPMIALLTGDADAVDLAELSDKLGLAKDQRRPGQICGHVFRSGEATYSCKECANDPTCVMCHECFSNSAHKSHRYTMHTSGGTGYCDCGDEEAWSSHVHCAIHLPQPTIDGADSDQVDMDTSQSVLEQIPESDLNRLRALCHMLVSYSIQALCADENKPEMSLLATVADQNHPLINQDAPYQTMLFNDETHTYDGVIRALELAINCSEQQAMLLATIIDREGRSSVRAGSKEWCTKAKDEIQRRTAKDRNERTGKTGPLAVQVLTASLVAHQQFAMCICNQLCTWTQQFAPLQEILSGIMLKEGLYKMPGSADSESESHLEQPLVKCCLLYDKQLWKGARNAVHSLIMSTMLMSTDTKSEFATIFTQQYPAIISEFLEDDHEHTASVASLTVQIYTVPTLARKLIAEQNALGVLLDCFLDHTGKYNDDVSGRYEFRDRSYPPYLRRALIIPCDIKYLLNTVPSPTDWTEQLKEGYLSGLQSLINFLKRMQGMDAVKRQTGEHQLWESEWETAFNMHLRFEDVHSMFIKWASSHPDVCARAVQLVVQALADYCLQPNSGVLPLKQVQMHLSNSTSSTPSQAEHIVECSVVAYDVAEQAVSIHIPISRLLAGLYVRLSLVQGVRAHDHIQECMNTLLDTAEGIAHLMELPLRVAVLTAQAQSGMWRRNGYALLNQIHNYFSPLCRAEMYDRDVLMLQIAASLLPANEFLMRCIHKFGLNRWVQLDYEEKLPPEELSKQVVTLAEELFHWIIVITGERYPYGLSEATMNDYVRREVIHLLCKGPTAYSKLQKRLSYDPLLEKLAIEDTVKEVAVFKRASGTAAGLFELKPEYRSHYTPFFYHYSKSDVSLAEEHQQKGRTHFLPPKAPKFNDRFASLPQLLNCDVMLHLMTLGLERTSRRSRFGGDGLLQRCLYIMGMALNEEETNPEQFAFTARAEQYAQTHNQPTLISLMNKMNNAPEASAVQDLLSAVLKQYKTCVDLHSRAQSADGEPMDSTNESANDLKRTSQSIDDEKAEKELRQKVAAEKRKKAMEQMQRLQKQFAQKNQALFEDDSEEHDPSDETCDTHKLVNSSSFPVVLGPNRELIASCRPRRLTCMLCQESTDTMQQPMVFAAFVQASSLFTDRTAVRKDYSQLNAKSPLDPLLMPVDMSTLPPIHVSTCAHVMHAKCYTRFHDSLKEKDNRRRNQVFMSSRLVKADLGEYQCPLCKRLCNSAMPVLPLADSWNAHTSSTKAAVHLPTPTFAQWLHTAPDCCTERSTMRRKFTSGGGRRPERISKKSLSEKASYDSTRTRTKSMTAQSSSTAAHVISDSDTEIEADVDPAVVAAPLPDVFAFLDETQSDDSHDTAIEEDELIEVEEGNDQGFVAALQEFAQDALAEEQQPAAAQANGNLAGGAQALLRIIPSFMSNRMQSLLQRPRKSKDERPIPPAFFDPYNAEYWISIRDFASAVALNGLGIKFALPVIKSAQLLWHASAYTVRCLSVVLKHENKPLFGACNVRQSDSLYGVCRSAAAAGCLFRANKLRKLHSKLLSAMLGKCNDESMCVLDMDCLHWMVSCVLSASALRSCDQECLDDTAHRPRFDTQHEYYTFTVALCAYLFQLLVTYDRTQLSSPNVSTNDLLRLILDEPANQQSDTDGDRLRQHVKCALTEFMRCAALFWHAVCGVPPPEVLKDPAFDEFSPLCRYLGLPTDFVELIRLISQNECEQLMDKWSSHKRVQLYVANQHTAAASSSTNHEPALIRAQPITVHMLIDLPAEFGELINKAVSFSCPMLDSDDSSRAPTICLLCGTMLCSQSYCCQHAIPDNQQVGACNWHIRQCAASPAAVFLRIRDSQILLMTSRFRGCFEPAPYVDEYGETDQGFRRGNPLRLNSELYDRLQSLWVSHGIAERVIGQYEINTNNLAIEWQHL